MKKPKGKKYSAQNLLPALRVFVKARREALDAGFTDNGGAIHSIERIVDILSAGLKYPHLSHINNLKNDPMAEMSVQAKEDLRNGIPVKLEHVMPQRAYSRSIADLVEQGNSDAEIIEYIQSKYRLILLSQSEARELDLINRSNMTADRIESAGIKMA